MFSKLVLKKGLAVVSVSSPSRFGKCAENIFCLAFVLVAVVEGKIVVEECQFLLGALHTNHYFPLIIAVGFFNVFFN